MLLPPDVRPVDLRGWCAQGGTPDSLRAALHRGEVRRVLRGAYVRSGTPDTLPLRAAAVALVLPPGAVVCRTTAAWLHGVDVLRIGEHLEVLPVEVLRPAGAAVVRRAGVRGWTGLLAAGEVTAVAGVPVTTAVRTALDLARWLDRPDALAHLDALLRLGAVTRGALAAALPALTGLPWVEQARELVALVDPGAESPMESRMRLRYLDTGLPRLHTQVPVRDGAGRGWARLDCALPERRWALEYDGEEWHGPDHARHDARRRARLARQGWDVLVVRREHVLGPGPAFERAVGEALGIEPRTRPYAARARTRSPRWPSRPLDPATQTAPRTA